MIKVPEKILCHGNTLNGANKKMPNAKAGNILPDESINPDVLPDDAAEILADLIGRRAENLFLTRQLECTEAVLVVLNEGLGGELSSELATRLASGLTRGIGESGCLCGALSGGVLGLGLFLGRTGPGINNNSIIQTGAGQLHDQFKKHCGATCCRVLTRFESPTSRTQFRACAERTGFAAKTAAGMILAHRPELTKTADWGYLRRRDSKLSGNLRRIRGLNINGR